jgi:hypothetical protein
MNGLSVRFRARQFHKEVSYVFVVAAFVDEVDEWSLSHVALALSALGLLVAICTLAFCVWALRRERVRRRSQVGDAVWEWAGGMANKDEVEKLKEAVSDLSERLTSLEAETAPVSDEALDKLFKRWARGFGA